MANNDDFDSYDEIFDMDDYITLEDEDGNEENFILVDVIDYKNKVYTVFMSAENQEEPFVIMEYVEDNGSEEGTYYGLDDDDLIDEIYRIFLKRLEESEKQ